MKIALSLTHSCNLACDYCYAGRSFNRHMSLETAQRAVDFAMERTQPHERIEFAFFGGEPLLRFELINWQKEHWERFASIFQQVADLYIASYERRQEVAINLIDGKIILFPLRPWRLGVRSLFRTVFSQSWHRWNKTVHARRSTAPQCGPGPGWHGNSPHHGREA